MIAVSALLSMLSTNSCSSVGAVCAICGAQYIPPVQRFTKQDLLNCIAIQLKSFVGGGNTDTTQMQSGTSCHSRLLSLERPNE